FRRIMAVSSVADRQHSSSDAIACLLDPMEPETRTPIPKRSRAERRRHGSTARASAGPRPLPPRRAVDYHRLMSTDYLERYARSLREPERFWAAAAEAIHWDRPWDRVLDDSRPPFYRWFVGGRLNTCYNALDFHVERGRGKQRALVWDSPVTGQVRAYTYA